MNNKLILIRSIIIAILFALFIGFLMFKIITKPEYQPNYKTTGQILCENKGGIFYKGSFSADNCVFPPSK